MTSDNPWPVNDPSAFREAMGGVVMEALVLIGEILSDADFTKDFPDILGGRDVLGDLYGYADSHAILLHKARMHAGAAMFANNDNNLHSLAVQLRVTLECAAYAVTESRDILEGGPRAAKRLSDAFDYDMFTQFRRHHGTALDDEIWGIIAGTRARFDEDSFKATKQTITNRLKAIAGGEAMYRFLSDNFCKCNDETLLRHTPVGGVLQTDEDAHAIAIGYLLGFLAEILLLMALGFGLVLTVSDSDRSEEIGDRAFALLEARRLVVMSFAREDKENGGCVSGS